MGVRRHYQLKYNNDGTRRCLIKGVDGGCTVLIDCLLAMKLPLIIEILLRSNIDPTLACIRRIPRTIRLQLVLCGSGGLAPLVSTLSESLIYPILCRTRSVICPLKSCETGPDGRLT